MNKFFISIFCFMLVICLVDCSEKPEGKSGTLKPTNASYKATPSLMVTVDLPTKIFTKTPTLSTATTKKDVPTVTTTAFSPTIAPVPELVAANVFKTLPSGNYLVFLDFQGEDCYFKAVSRDGKVFSLAPCGVIDYLTMPENGAYVSFDQGYVYNLKDQTMAKLKSPYFQCTIGLSSLSWDGSWMAGIWGSLGNQYQLCIRELRTDWQTLKLFEKESGDVRGNPSWSSDGKQVAFAYDNSKSVEYPQTGIYIVDVLSCLRDVPNCPSHVQGPFSRNMGDYLFWSPDSRYLAMSTYTGIEVMDLRTNKTRILIDYRTEKLLIHGLSWSPDGKWIGYAVDKSQYETASNLFMISLSGGKPVLLAENVGPQVLAWIEIPPKH